MMQTIQQLRAQRALAKVQGLVPLNDGAKLKARASELPFMIHVNGLGAAMAFFCSKGDKDGYGHLYAVLNDWLCSDGRPLAGHQDLMQAITRSDMTQYRLAQAEAMVYLDWVKKFAQAYL